MCRWIAIAATSITGDRSSSPKREPAMSISRFIRCPCFLATRARWHLNHTFEIRCPLNVHKVQQLSVLGMYVEPLFGQPEIGRAHVLTPVTNAHLVCRLLL